MMITVQGLYLALLGRPADPINLAYFNLTTHDGADLAAMAGFSDQAECRERFAGMSPIAILEAIHQSLFAHPADRAKLAPLAEGLAAGRQSMEAVAIGLLAGATGADLVTLETRLAAADLFTASLALGAASAAYSGPAAAAIGRDYMDAVTTHTPATAERVEQAVSKLLMEHEAQARRNSLRRILLPAGPGADREDRFRISAIGAGPARSSQDRFADRLELLSLDDNTLPLNLRLY